MPQKQAWIRMSSIQFKGTIGASSPSPPISRLHPVSSGFPFPHAFPRLLYHTCVSSGFLFPFSTSSSLVDFDPMDAAWIEGRVRAIETSIANFERLLGPKPDHRPPNEDRDTWAALRDAGDAVSSAVAAARDALENPRDGGVMDFELPKDGLEAPLAHVPGVDAPCLTLRQRGADIVTGAAEGITKGRILAILASNASGASEFAASATRLGGRVVPAVTFGGAPGQNRISHLKVLLMLSTTTLSAGSCTRLMRSVFDSADAVTADDIRRAQSAM